VTYNPPGLPLTVKDPANDLVTLGYKFCRKHHSIEVARSQVSLAGCHLASYYGALPSLSSLREVWYTYLQETDDV